MADEFIAALPVQLVPAEHGNGSAQVTNYAVDEPKKRRASRAPAKRLYIEDGNMYYDGSSEDEYVARKKRVSKKKDFLTGGQSSTEESDYDDKGRPRFYNDPKGAFAARAKQIVLNKENYETFFKVKDQIFKFGKTSIVIMRLGYDKQAGIFKVYLKKENRGFDAKPSILGLAFCELDEVMQHLEETIAKINTGLEMGDAYLRPADGEAYQIIKIDSVDIWKKDCFHTESGGFRIRSLWQQEDKYQFIFNMPIEHSEKFPNFQGPTIRLSKDEILMFLAKARALQAKAPGWEQLMEM